MCLPYPKQIILTLINKFIVSSFDFIRRRTKSMLRSQFSSNLVLLTLIKHVNRFSVTSVRFIEETDRLADQNSSNFV